MPTDRLSRPSDSQRRPRARRYEQPWHLALVAIYPVWALWALNSELTPAGQALAASCVSLALAGLLWLAMRPLLASPGRAALLATLGQILIWSFGHLVAGLDSIMAGRRSWWLPSLQELGTDANQVVGLAAILVFLLGLGWLVRRRLRARPEETGLHLFLNVALATACAQVCLRLLANPAPPLLDDRYLELPAKESAGAVQALGYQPDVYLILLDGYARADVLQRYYDFDNSPFLQGLRDLGMEVWERSFANHNRTYLSLASLLNLETMEYLEQELGADSVARTVPYQLIRRSRLARFLVGQGYSFVQLSSTWGATLENPYADDVPSCGGGIFERELYRALADNTPLRLARSWIGQDLARCALENFQHLHRLPKEPGPKLVLAHFIPPHHPYLFDRHGTLRRHLTISNRFRVQDDLWQQKTEYLEQLRFVNHKVLQALSAIVRDSQQPPLIVLMSDHGPELRKIKDPQQRALARLANLLAVYTPDRAPVARQPLSLVNLSRALLHQYFGANLPEVADHGFISPYTKPYSFGPPIALATAQPVASEP